MLQTFFGLDLKTGGKVVIVTTLIENIIFCVLSLNMFMEHYGVENDYKSTLYEIENHVKLSEYGQKIFKWN